jgi:hypothetical protein
MLDDKTQYERDQHQIKRAMKSNDEMWDEVDDSEICSPDAVDNARLAYEKRYFRLGLPVKTIKVSFQRFWKILPMELKEEWKSSDNRPKNKFLKMKIEKPSTGNETDEDAFEVLKTFQNL